MIFSMLSIGKKYRKDTKVLFNNNYVNGFSFVIKMSVIKIMALFLCWNSNIYTIRLNLSLSLLF